MSDGEKRGKCFKKTMLVVLLALCVCEGTSGLTQAEALLRHPSNLNLSVFSNLLRLDLKENNLTGPIPQNIGVLSKLQFLDLSTNHHLNGTLPLSIANLTQVYELDVSRSNITGILDPRLFPDGSDRPKSGLIGIRNLLFQDTQLGGRIPNEIGNIRNLTLLALDGNNFYGGVVYRAIIEATNNFDDQYCIGEGALAKVYRAEMQGGQVYAVKKLKCDADNLDVESINSFQSEIEATTETRHRNIVKLYGFCSQGMHPFLIYEYMDKGNLADVLRDDKVALELDWHKRVDIIKGVASALSYMHHDCATPLIHRDISSKNVLLSSNLDAHVSGFLKPEPQGRTYT
ncbi:leucine-rich repeat receptor protein kinase [Spatholobus suberectus]|nr:leucine-rich repeat receptor protein kinase [Spatholobus suberectus]